MKDDISSGDNCKNQVEALLFASGKKLEVGFIEELISSKNKEFVRGALRELKREYDERDSPLMILEEGSSWKISVREKYLPLVRKIVADTELSKTVMETLAIIAWKSPVLQSEIIHIRTNKAYDHINELLESGFITKEKHGRSFMLKVTNKFYEYFDVEGAEGIRDVFARIKEKPEQKKVDEFNDAAPASTVKETEEENEKIGNLKVYDEDDKTNEDGDSGISGEEKEEFSTESVEKEKETCGEHTEDLEESVKHEENSGKQGEKQ